MARAVSHHHDAADQPTASASDETIGPCEPVPEAAGCHHAPPHLRHTPAGAGGTRCGSSTCISRWAHISRRERTRRAQGARRARPPPPAGAPGRTSHLSAPSRRRHSGLSGGARGTARSPDPRSPAARRPTPPGPPAWRPGPSPPRSARFRTTRRGAARWLCTGGSAPEPLRPTCARPSCL